MANTRCKSKIYLALICGGSFICCSGCYPQTATTSKSQKPVAPAKVELVPHESELATITLTKEAEERLGVKTVATEIRRVQQHRIFGGEVMIPSGRSIMISAPVSGIILANADGKLPAPGSRFKAGETVLTIKPLLSPEREVPTPVEQVQIAGTKATLVSAQVTAIGDVQRGKADVAAAKIALDRAKKLFDDRAGSQRAVDDAQAVFNLANTGLSAAEERQLQLARLIDSLDGKTLPGKVSEIPLNAPVEGVIRSLSISSGQQVVAGATLFEVLDTSTVWVRVPIFVDLLRSIEPSSQGRVVSLDGNSRADNERRRNNSNAVVSGRDLLLSEPAIQIDAPPTADASSSSVDIYFEVANQSLKLRPGQRVGIEIPMESEVDASVVPAASILYDIYGGTWVYTLKEPQKFVRQRVTVRWFDGPNAVLQKGPNVGTLIVGEGAAELFGTEFGPGK